MNTQFLSVVDTAKLIRSRLKALFPNAIFSVRSEKFSGGGSVDISWTDGPAATLVDAIVKMYAGGKYDDVLDQYIDVKHWLMPDGTTQMVESVNNLPPEQLLKPHPESKLVSFGASFVTTTRAISTAMAVKIYGRLRRKGMPDNVLEMINHSDGTAFIVRARRGADDMREWELRAGIEQDRFMVA